MSMSRRAITKAVRNLKSEIITDIEQIIIREMGRLEAATATPTTNLTSGTGQPSDPSPAPATEKGGQDQAGHITITPATGQAIYAVIEGCEDVIHAGRSGKMRLFEQKACELEDLISRIDDELLDRLDLSN